MTSNTDQSTLRQLFSSEGIMTKSASGKSTLTFIHLLVLFLCSGLAFAVEPTVTSCGECVGALKSDGTVWVWGKNDEPGLLGLGKQREALFPTRIPSLDRVRSLSMNSNHFLVARED